MIYYYIMFYDVIIIGGGIAGLNIMYQLSKKSPQLQVLLLEKESYLGGRIFTHHDKYMDVEAGAGRFSGSHTYLMQLIQDLGLKSKMVEISSTAVYAPADGTGSIQSSVSDAPAQTSLFDPLYNNLLDIQLGNYTLPCAGLISRIILASKLETRSLLQSMSFIDYANKVLRNPEQIQFIKDTFGYYSELVIMNAHDAIVLMERLSPLNKFYSLNGGLSQVIDKMVASIKKCSGYKIMLHKEVRKIVHLVGEMGGTGFEIHVDGRNTWYGAKQCVCALPKQVLEKIRIFTPVRSMLKKIECGSLCRIYSQFDKDEIWFKKLCKFTTNNELRMVIPMDTQKGIIMISYSDNKFADYWERLYSKQGIREVNRRLQSKIKESLGINIPLPKHTKVFYWGCGVGYWGVGADSAAISKQIIQPMNNMKLFVCGEHYSETNQQWMEGALETGVKVLERLI